MKLAERIFRRKDYYITSPYGFRKDPISGVNKFHNGCDYGTNREKWKQYALEDGVVVSAGKDLSGGIYAWVRFPRINIEVLYYHLDQVFVKKNQAVTENTVIGTTGMSGYATGIHLHLTYRKIGSSAKLDPELFVYNLPIKNDEMVNTGNHLVTRGDTLSAIAKKYGTTISEIMSLNPIIKDRNLIITGWNLKIPTNNKNDLKIGDRVKILKSGKASSTGAGAVAGGIGWNREILKIYKGREYPYQVGNSSGTTGFYKKDALEKI